MSIAVIRDLLDLLPKAPEPNCSCHVAPPCGDCVDWAHQREVVEQAEAIISKGEQASAAEPAEQWRPMDTAPRDGTMLRLLVEFSEHATEDSTEASPTIGAWSATGEDDADWQFAGWCWTHDHFTEGKGKPVGWLPMLSGAKP